MLIFFKSFNLDTIFIVSSASGELEDAACDRLVLLFPFPLNQFCDNLHSQKHQHNQNHRFHDSGSVFDRKAGSDIMT